MERTRNEQNTVFCLYNESSLSFEIRVVYILRTHTHTHIKSIVYIVTVIVNFEITTNSNEIHTTLQFRFHLLLILRTKKRHHIVYAHKCVH